MGDTVLVDELHLTVRVPTDLAEPEIEAVRRTLAGDAFADRLRDAVAAVAREFSDLAPVSTTVSR